MSKPIGCGVFSKEIILLEKEIAGFDRADRVAFGKNRSFLWL
jgi:hypothetical protein